MNKPDYYYEDRYDAISDAEDRADKAYLNRLRRHPDCRDPDHPGCDACRDEDDED